MGALPAGTYDRRLPAFPAEPAIDCYRGNFCGTGVPAHIERLDGMAGKTVPAFPRPPLMVGVDLTRYWKRGMKDDVGELLLQYATDGNTHIQCSVGHAVLQGLTIDEYVAFLGRVRQDVEFLDIWFGGGAWSPQDDYGNWTEHRDQHAAHYRPIYQPWIDALLAHGLMDAYCVSWQSDRGNTPGGLKSVIQYLAETIKGRNASIRSGIHWITHGCSWFDDCLRDQDGNIIQILTPPAERCGTTDRFAWWDDMRRFLDWNHFQYDVDGELEDTQGRIGEVLKTCDTIVTEVNAQKRFDCKRTEDEADLRSLICICAKGRFRVLGFGDGGRLRNGSPVIAAEGTEV